MTPTPEKSKKDGDKAQRKREDEVLRRLLKTPPKPHKPKDEVARREKQRATKK